MLTSLLVNKYLLTLIFKNYSYDNEKKMILWNFYFWLNLSFYRFFLVYLVVLVSSTTNSRKISENKLAQLKVVLPAVHQRVFFYLCFYIFLFIFFYLYFFIYIFLFMLFIYVIYLCYLFMLFIYVIYLCYLFVIYLCLLFMLFIYLFIFIYL